MEKNKSPCLRASVFPPPLFNFQFSIKKGDPNALGIAFHC